MADVNEQTLAPDYSVGHVRGFYMARECVLPAETPSRTYIPNFNVEQSPPKIENVFGFVDKAINSQFVNPSQAVSVGFFSNMLGSNYFRIVNIYGLRTSIFVDGPTDAHHNGANGWVMQANDFPLNVIAKLQDGRFNVSATSPVRSLNDELDVRVGSLAYDKFRIGLCVASDSVATTFRSFVVRWSGDSCYYAALKSSKNESAVFELTHPTTVEI